MKLTQIIVTLLILLRFIVPIQAEESWIETTENAKPEVRGIVVDSEGKPVSGAVVRSDFDKVQCETDETGRFALRLPYPQSRQLRVYKSDKSQLALSTFLFKSQADPESGEFRIPLVPARKLTGKVLDAKKNPISGATVWCTSVGTQGITDISETDQDGNFVLHHPVNLPLGLVAAQKSGFGIDFHPVNEPYPQEGEPKPEEKVARGEVENGPFTISLTGAKTIRFKAIDTNDKPLEGIEFSVWLFQRNNGSLNPVGLGFIRQNTDASGIAVFDWLPNWTQNHVEFAGWYRKPLHRLLPQTLRVNLQDSPEEVTAVFESGVFVRGTVLLPDGEPAVKWRVEMNPSSGRMESFQTNRRGRYQFCIGRNQDFQISVQQWDEETMRPTTVPDGVAPTLFNMNSEENGHEGLDFHLRKPTRVFGRMIGNPPPDTLGHFSRIRISEGNPELSDPENEYMMFWNSPHRSTQVKEDNSFECWLPSGTFKLYPEEMTMNSSRSNKSKVLEITDQSEIQMDFDVASDTVYRDITVHLERPDGSKNDLRDSTVCLFDPVEKEGEEPYIVLKKIETEAAITFKAPNREMGVLAIAPDYRFGKCEKLDPDKTEITLRLEPTGSVSGIITNESKNDEPLVDRLVEVHPKKMWVYSNPRTKAKTDANGRFEITGLVPEVDYDLRFPLSPRDWPNHTRAWRPLKTVKVESAKTLDVGSFSCNPNLGGQSEFSWAFWGIYVSHLGGKNFDTLFSELTDRAKKENKRLLVLFCETGHGSLYHEFTHFHLAGALYGNPVVAPLFEQFVFMGIPTDKQSQFNTPHYENAKRFARRLGVDDNEAVEQPTLCVFDSDGKLLHTDTFAEIMEHGPLRNGKPHITVNHVKLMEFLKKWSNKK